MVMVLYIKFVREVKFPEKFTFRITYSLSEFFPVRSLMISLL